MNEESEMQKDQMNAERKKPLSSPVAARTLSDTVRAPSRSNNPVERNNTRR